MRIMSKFSLPIEASNDAVRSGKLQKVSNSWAKTSNLRPAISSPAVASEAVFST
jgi:hypothetical protein